MISINKASFIETSKDEDGNSNGTVELTLFGETRRVEARMLPEYDWIFAYGVEGQYRTSNKWWSGSVQIDGNDRMVVRFGRYDNHPKFNKTNIRFER